MYCFMYVYIVYIITELDYNSISIKEKNYKAKFYNLKNFIIV